MKKLIMFVMVLAIASPSLGQLVDIPPEWGNVGTVTAVWDFATEPLYMDIWEGVTNPPDCIENVSGSYMMPIFDPTWADGVLCGSIWYCVEVPEGGDYVTIRGQCHMAEGTIPLWAEPQAQDCISTEVDGCNIIWEWIDNEYFEIIDNVAIWQWTWERAAEAGPIVAAGGFIQGGGFENPGPDVLYNGLIIDIIVHDTPEPPTGAPRSSDCFIPDTNSPSPDPMTFAQDPSGETESTISMTATTATDRSRVEYYFDCTSGGGNDSGWQDDTSYTDTGLTPSTEYCYRVRARDKSSNQNTTAWSITSPCGTTRPPDMISPIPNPMTWAYLPAASGSSSISMIATTATDLMGVEYYFDETSSNPGGSDSGWQDSETYTDTGLSESTQYCYRVQARDKSANQNTGGWSTPNACSEPAAAGETLYNGIVLPPTWPPDYGSVPYEPMPVPYLDDPPAVVLIDVGRQLFVDDFLIDTTDMTQTYHQVDYYSGNPVITTTTAEEVDIEGNKMAGPFSGGSWYDPCDSLYKMWYRGAMAGQHSHTYAQLYATSTDGKDWDRPNLDVNPVVLLDHFTCTPSNPSANDEVTIDAYDEYNQQVDLGDYDLVEFCWENNLCVDTGSGITIDASGGAVFTCTQAMLDKLPYFDFLAENASPPPQTEVFSLPFPFDTIDRAGNSVYPLSEADAFHRDSTAILLDHNAAASERFKWFATEFPNGGAYLRYRKSSDGIHWSAPQSSKSIWGDRTTVFYNPFRDVWVCSQRTEDASGRRNRCYTEGTSAANLMSKIQYNEMDDATGDSVHWVGADPCDPRHTDPLWDHIEPQLYTLDAMPYESVMLGQFSIWQGPYNADCETYWVPKRNDILLGFSRDGFHWDRPDRTRFISSTWDEQSWRMGNVQSVVGTPLVVGDELYFYFNGRPKPAPNAEDWDKDYQAGLALLRRDGFASMDASGSAKTLTTRPVSFANGKYLFVNVDCPSGSLKVEVLNEASQVISPYTLANCDAISADTTCTQVTWGGSCDLSALQDDPIRFRFTLTNGSLYAFWVSPDASGASYGYVGGGGPGFTGPTDTVQYLGADIDGSGDVNFVDFAMFAEHWLETGCAQENDWCGGADFAETQNGEVDVNDLALLADNWLVSK